MTRIVVLGAGVSGLCAAAAARGPGREVMVVERDSQRDGAERRRGNPQAGQLHNLLHAAHSAIERLVPGFLARIVDGGAVVADVSSQTYVYEHGRRMPERDLGMQIASAELPSVQRALRELVTADGAVTVREATAAEKILVGSDGVGGIRVAASNGTETIEADMLVDAMGVKSPMTRWLAELNRPVPCDIHQVEQWYSTAVYQVPPHAGAPHLFWMVFPTPTSTKGCLAARMRGDRVRISVSGRGGDRPPRSSKQHLAYAASLDDPVLAGLLAVCEPADDPTLFRKTNAIWRHYEAMTTPTPRLLPIGDAYASLNPLFGQGISVAALQAAALTELLESDDPELTGSYLAGASAAIRRAWELGQLVDIDVDPSMPSVAATSEGVQAFVDLLLADPRLHRDYVAVWHLMQPASIMQTPQLAARLRDRIPGPAPTGDRVAAP